MLTGNCSKTSSCLKNKFIPTILIKTDSLNQWFTKHLKSLLNRKKRLYRSAKLRNNTDAWEEYRLCADQYMKEVAEAKAKYFSVDLLSIVKSNPNMFWRLLSAKSSSN